MFDFIKEREAFENKVWLSSPTMHGPELEYIKEAYETNWMSTVGANINEVERLASEKVGCKYAVALSAGTAALHMAVKLAGVKPGDKVTANQTVAVLEAMKMENEIEAGYAGTVSEVKVAERDTVLEGAVLITISN